MINSVTSAYSPLATSGTTGSTPRSQSSNVSIQDFMKLLSAEMTNQDPTKPMDPTQTMTQLAQFTTLQQTTQLAQNQSVATAIGLIGSYVSVPGTNGSAPISGVVQSVDSSEVASGGVPSLMISGSTQRFPVTSVTQISLNNPKASVTSPTG